MGHLLAKVKTRASGFAITRSPFFGVLGTGSVSPCLSCFSLSCFSGVVSRLVSGELDADDEVMRLRNIAAMGDMTVTPGNDSGGCTRRGESLYAARMASVILLMVTWMMVSGHGPASPSRMGGRRGAFPSATRSASTAEAGMNSGCRPRVRLTTAADSQGWRTLGLAILALPLPFTSTFGFSAVIIASRSASSMAGLHLAELRTGDALN